MDGISGLAAILQILGNTINLALQTAKFVNSLRNAEEFQNDFLQGLELSRNTVRLMTTQLEDIDVEECYIQETREINKLVHEIARDCKKCNESLAQLYQFPSNTISSKVAGVVRREIRRPEIESVNARFRSNVGNIQALLSVLQLIASKRQTVRTERVEERLQDIQAKLLPLQELRAEVMAALNNLNNREVISKIDGSGSIEQICDEIVLSRDAGACIRITEGTFKTAKSICERFSRDGSAQNSSISDGILDNPYSSSMAQLEPNDGTSLPLSTINIFLDGYVQEMNEEFEKGAYQKCKKYIHEALDWGECRYLEHNVDFHQRFDLQLRLAEVYEKEGNFQDARKYISSLWESSVTDAPDYRKFSNLQELQLRCATARLFLHEYEQGHNKGLDELKQEAVSAFGAAITAFHDASSPQEEESSSANLTLPRLLIDSAETLDRVYDILADPVGRRSLRVELSILRVTLPELEPIAQSTPAIELDSSPSGPVLNISSVPDMSTLRPASTCGSSDVCAPTSTISHKTDVTRPSEPANLLSAGPDDNMDVGVKYLLKAAKTHNLQILQDKCDEFLPHINAKDEAGMNALHHALTRIGGDDIVRLLIANGADVNAKDNHGDTPLHYCVQRSNYTGARLLLKTKNVVIESVNNANQTPAKLAVNQSTIGNTDMLKLLVRYEANFDWPGIPRDIRNRLRALGYETGASHPHRDVPVTGQALKERRGSRASQSSHSSQYSRWLRIIGRNADDT